MLVVVVVKELSQNVASLDACSDAAAMAARTGSEAIVGLVRLRWNGRDQIDGGVPVHGVAISPTSSSPTRSAASGSSLASMISRESTSPGCRLSDAVVVPRTIDLVAQPKQGAPMPEGSISRQDRLGEGEARTRVVERSMRRSGRATATSGQRRRQDFGARRDHATPMLDRAGVLGRSDVGSVVTDHDAILDRDAELVGDRSQGAGIGLGRVAVGAGDQGVVGDVERAEQALGIPARAVGENPDLEAHVLDLCREVGRLDARPVVE